MTSARTQGIVPRTSAVVLPLSFHSSTRLRLLRYSGCHRQPTCYSAAVTTSLTADITSAA